MPRKTFIYEGKRYDITATTNKELTQKIASKKRELKKKKDEQYIFSVWFEIFIDTYKPNISEETKKLYMFRYNKHIKPAFGTMKINKITNMDCQKFLNGLKGYSGDYIRKLYRDLSQVFEAAIINEIIDSNPIKKCVLPKGKDGTHRSLTPEEQKAVIETAKTNKYGIYVMLMLCCGLRPQETAYVQGKDIQNDILHVRGTKTENADRYVPIPKILLDMIPNIKEETYLCPTSNGKAPTNKDNRRAMWKCFKNELSKRIEVKDDVTPYCLRHTYCTNLQDAGVPINIAKDFMGHSSIDLTSRIYTHLSEASFEHAKHLINSHTFGKENLLKDNV